MPFVNTTPSILAVGLFVVLAAAGVNADTITVCWDGSGDYTTIQAGIDAASDGDEVVVCAGTYTGEGNCEMLERATKATLPQDRK